MSFWVLQNGFAQVRPTVTHSPRYVTIRANFIVRFVSLFGYDRKIVLDKYNQIVHVRQVSWWFPKLKTYFKYDMIRSIGIERKALANDFNLFSIFLGRYDELEFWRVYLEFNNSFQPRMHLVTFRGEGSKATGFLGWSLGGDSAVDYHGNQEQQAKRFAGMLATLLDKPVKNRQNEFETSYTERHSRIPGKRDGSI